MPAFTNVDRVTKRDIRDFDPKARALVADFHRAGWRSYLSHQGHAIMLAPDGQTTASVSGNTSKGHGAKWARADLNRWLRAQRRARPENHTETENHTDNRSEPVSITSETMNANGTTNVTQHTIPAPKTFTCPDCPGRAFRTAGALTLHRQRSHDGLKCPDCGQVFPPLGGSAWSYKQHRREVHGVPDKIHYTPGPDGKYRCPWCPKVYDRVSQLATHAGRNHHGQPLPDIEPERAAPVVTVTTTPTQTVEPVQAVEPVAEVVTPAPAPSGDALEAWLAAQDAGALLSQVVALVAAPLAGEVERLRRERDELVARVAQLEARDEEREARMALVREAMDA